jgi:hypothetical protein
VAHELYYPELYWILILSLKILEQSLHSSGIGTTAIHVGGTDKPLYNKYLLSREAICRSSFLALQRKANQRKYETNSYLE